MFYRFIIMKFTEDGPPLPPLRSLHWSGYLTIFFIVCFNICVFTCTLIVFHLMLHKYKKHIFLN